MKINQASKQTGVSTRMIRFYEQNGLLAKINRTSANYREYTAADIAMIKDIYYINQLGIKLADIKSILPCLYHIRHRHKLCNNAQELLNNYMASLKLKIIELQRIYEKISLIVRSQKANKF